MSKRSEPSSDDVDIPAASDAKRIKVTEDKIATMTSELEPASSSSTAVVPSQSLASATILASEPSASTSPPAQPRPKKAQGPRNEKKGIDRRGKRSLRNAEWGTKPRPPPAGSNGGENGSGEGGDGGEEVEKAPRLAKRKCAILMGFCGTGYSGMQFQISQKETKTIEGDLFDALVKAGAVSTDNSDDPSKVSLSRAARTDAGVHAAGNLVSLKLITSIPKLEEEGVDLVDRINEFLPETMRVWGILRSSNNFNARTSCDSRVYEYLFPSYILMPPHASSPLGIRLSTSTTSPVPPSSTSAKPIPSLEEMTAIPSLEEMTALRQAYRLPPSSLTRLNALLKELEGTHNFWNFTVGRDFKDRAAGRYMLKIEAREPQVYDGLEWVSVLFHGQSFMLHQRKMIGLVMLAARTETPASLIPQTYGPSKIHIPRAPALGLLLEQPRFGVYNLRAEEGNAALRAKAAVAAIDGDGDTVIPGSTATDGDESKANGEEEKTKGGGGGGKEGGGGATMKDPIDFEIHREKIKEFKVKRIYATMRAQEAESHPFARWLASIDNYTGTDFDYLNREGVIPPSAIRKKGERRNDAFAEPAEEDVEREVESGKGGRKGRGMEELEG